MPINVLDEEVKAVNAGVETAQQIATEGRKFDWEAILDDTQKAKARAWAGKIDVTIDTEISGFGSQVMKSINEISAKILKASKGSKVPEVAAIFKRLVTDLDGIDFDKLNDEGTFNKALNALEKLVGKVKEEFQALIARIESIEQKAANIEAEIVKLMSTLVEYIEFLNILKVEYKKAVPIVCTCVYAMQLVIEREEGNLKLLEAKAQTFRDEHKGQTNPIFDQEVKDKQTQIDLCRERLLQLSYLAAKGYIMMPVVELLAKAARLVRSQMEDTINSTLPNIRAVLALILGQSAMAAGNEAVKYAQSVEKKTMQALANRLGQTADMIAAMPKNHEDRVELLKTLALKVRETNEAFATYSADMAKAVEAVDVKVEEITRLISTTAKRDKVNFDVAATAA